MRITPDMPKEPGGTVEEHGALIELADFQDDDGTGVKATVQDSQGGRRIRIKIDSYDPFGATIWLTPADAVGLATTLGLLAHQANMQNALDDAEPEELSPHA